MKKMFVLLILSFFLVNFAIAFAADKTKEETQKRIEALEKQITELKQLIEEQNQKISTSEPTKETLKPIAPVRPAINAYINQQIAAGPHIVAIKNASSKIWMAFEINSRPVIFIKNGFPNIYKSNQGIVNCLPPGEVAFLELEEIGGRTTVKASGYTGIAEPLKFRKEKSRPYKFEAYVEQYQIVIFDRWDF